MEPDWSQVRRLMFVCHGNICRSPMAECLMAHLLAQRGLTHITVASCATSDEEEGNSIYPPAREVLLRHGIPVLPHRARQVCPSDVENYDLFLCAESVNIRNLVRVVGPAILPKTHRLLDFTGSPRDIADPWYTGDFTKTWNDLLRGCNSILAKLATR